MPAEPDCSSKLQMAGHNRELQAHLMSLDDIELNEDDQDRLFTEYTINTVHASYAAAQSRVQQYTQLLTLLRCKEDEWARKVEKAKNILPHYKPNTLHCSWESDMDFHGLSRHHSTCKHYQKASALAAQKRRDRAKESTKSLQLLPTSSTRGTLDTDMLDTVMDDIIEQDDNITATHGRASPEKFHRSSTY
ncbi:uncharacterized protein F5891DRAFT_976635 [Suillus fuscotomentosus]|uniref:Uncharacterized protein n=1 Tax=Suillus fuscotomentosus TaxID=1912939 RepID=A0AAD4EFB1_9AGAM|nr:uncharacterized protein F5891DRAFT_976635 [Suillus fuscotomentosus]KAG1905075.1 hypothetical protein F5891DRAFT_976635 [Suillus fuscotomentosus]